MLAPLLLHGLLVASSATDTAFELLLAHKQATGAVGAALVRGAAQAAGRSEDTLYRWLRQQRQPKPRPRFELTAEERRLLAACRGVVAEMVRRLERDGKARAHRRTYERAVREEFAPVEVAFYKHGDRAWRQKTLSALMIADHRGDSFHMDHTLVKLWLVTRSRSRWLRVWLTVVIDAKTKRIMAHTVSFQPNEGIVLATLRKAFTGKYGCVPTKVIWDNGAEFLADGVTEAANALNFAAAPIEAYSPWQNGKIERFFGTLEREFTRFLPYYGKGPRGKNGKLYGPKAGPLTVEQFMEKLDAWIDYYNSERPHSTLDGLTPDEAWKRDVAPLRKLPEERLRFMLLREKQTRVVRTYGVRWNNSYYTSDELLAYAGKKVSVRYMPHDYRQIWVFDADDEQLICIAKPTADLDEKERKRFTSKRSGQLARLRSHLPSRSLEAEPQQPDPDEDNPDAADGGAAAAAAGELNEAVADAGEVLAEDLQAGAVEASARYSNLNEALD